MYARKLSPFERISLATDSIHPFEANLIVEGTGDLSPELLQKAVNQAAEVNPGVRVRLKGMLGFAKWVDSGIPPRVKVVDGGSWDGRDDRNAPFLNAHFKPLEGGAVCDVLLVAGMPGRIVFRCCHAAADGRGHLLWVNDVFRVLRGEQPVGSPSQLTNIDIARKFKDKLPAGKPADPSASPNLLIIEPSPDDGKPLSYVWRSTQIESGHSNLIGKAAACLAAYARRHGVWPRKLQYTSRPACPGARAVDGEPDLLPDRRVRGE